MPIRRRVDSTGCRNASASRSCDAQKKRSLQSCRRGREAWQGTSACRARGTCGPVLGGDRSGGRRANGLPSRLVSWRALVSRWFRQGGGMPPLCLAPVSGRYLSFPEREEIAVLLAGGCGGERSLVSWVGRRRRLPGCNATQRSAAAGRSIEPRPPIRMLTDARDDRSRRSSWSTRSCGPMFRTGFPGRCSGRRERRGSAGRLAWAASRAAKGPALGTMLEPGADLLSAKR